jgi:cytochrome c553
MSRRLFLVAVAILAVGSTAPALAGDAAAGKAVYDSAKPACKGCHTEAANPLTRAGADNTVEELKAWIRSPKETADKKGKKRTMPAYPPARISDADLENLVAYLATLQ